MVKRLVAVGVFAALAACSPTQGSGSPSAADPPSATSTVATADPTPSTSTPTSAATILADRPVHSLPLDQVELDRVALKGGGGPDWMVSGFGSLWVRRDNAVVNRLAPDGSVQATVDAGIWQQPVCQGLGISATAVWACATSGKLMRIDPQTNEVSAIVDVPKVNEQGRLVSSEHRIWVLTGDGDQLVGVSERTNKPGPPIELGTYCTDVADTVLGTDLWVACPYDGVVLRVDLGEGKVTGRVDGLPHANAVVADQDVWACTEEGIARVDDASLSIAALQPAIGGLECSLRLSGDLLWVRTPSSYLTAIDTSTGDLAQVITAPGPASGGDVVEYSDALWVSAYERGFVYKLDRLMR